VQHLTLAFSGAVSGLGQSMRNLLHGLRCNALLDGNLILTLDQAAGILARPDVLEDNIARRLAE
jgi:hypothetical protein